MTANKMTANKMPANKMAANKMTANNNIQWHSLNLPTNKYDQYIYFIYPLFTLGIIIVCSGEKLFIP